MCKIVYVVGMYHSWLWFHVIKLGHILESVTVVDM